MVGAKYLEDGACTFEVWAPLKQRMILQIVHPFTTEVEMVRNDRGYFRATVMNAGKDVKYFYKPEGEKGLPDPASNYQPQGVHGPSQVVDHRSFTWSDSAWKPLPFKELVLYEIHVGTFTPEGTFQAIIPRLQELSDTGFNAIEIMPVAQFPGSRNWGYDAVYPYAVQESYGGPEGLKQLVDACHRAGIAVFLDVVYNHLGPEGNYLSEFGPYFTSRYSTPWGDALNFDGEYSDGVRDYFSDNIIYWFDNYHIDGVRCDAIHMVFDMGAVHFWQLCHQKTREAEARLGRKLYLTAESDLNSPQVVKLPDSSGYGFDAQWLDDFHHALYVLLDAKGWERYVDFGRIEQLAKAYTDGFVHSGEYVKARKKKYGRSSAGMSGEKFIIFNQNHDQIGNRVNGERLTMLVDFERQKLGMAAMLLAPYVPMFFMGEEYADDTPFFYFVSHSDAELIKMVQEGRKKEFDFDMETDPPDPQAEDTFSRSVIHWELRNTGNHKKMLDWTKKLLLLRRTLPALQTFEKNDLKAYVLNRSAMVLHRQSEGGSTHLLCLFNFADTPAEYTFSTWADQWQKLIDSGEEQWGGKHEKRSALPDTVTAGEKVQLPAVSAIVYVGR